MASIAGAVDLTKRRTPVPEATATTALFQQDRTCCVCRAPGRAVQLHHVDGNPDNNSLENLAVLCLQCHDEAHHGAGLGRKLSRALVAQFRTDWVATIERRRADIEAGLIKSIIEARLSEHGAFASAAARLAPAAAAGRPLSPVSPETEEPNYARIEKAVLAAAEGISDQLSVSLRLEPNLLVEAIRRAMSEFRSDAGTPSLAREVSLLAFWISAIRPIAVVPPISPGRIMEMAALVLDQMVFGRSGPKPSRDAKAAYDRALDAYASAACFPVNEMVAMTLIAESVELEARRTALRRQAPDPPGLSLLYDHAFEQTVHQLRGQVFSSQSFAAHVQTIFDFCGVVSQDD